MSAPSCTRHHDPTTTHWPHRCRCPRGRRTGPSMPRLLLACIVRAVGTAPDIIALPPQGRLRREFTGRLGLHDFALAAQRTWSSAHAAPLALEGSVGSALLGRPTGSAGGVALRPVQPLARAGEGEPGCTCARGVTCDTTVHELLALVP